MIDAAKKPIIQIMKTYPTTDAIMVKTTLIWSNSSWNMGNSDFLRGTVIRTQDAENISKDTDIRGKKSGVIAWSVVPGK